MSDIKEILLRLKDAEPSPFWYGPPSESAVKGVETALGFELPDQYKEFLLITGGGALGEETLSGIVCDDAERLDKGTIVGDTLRCREVYGLPDCYMVFYFNFEQICWCLDTREHSVGRVVSYSLPLRRVERQIAPSFRDFLEEFVDDYLC